MKLFQLLRSYAIPILLVLAYGGLLTVAYLYQRHGMIEESVTLLTHRWTHELERMAQVVERAGELQDPSRIRDEINFAAADLDLRLYLIIDGSNQIQFANHGIWRGNKATEVVQDFSPRLQAKVVTADTPLVLPNLADNVLTVYYPLTASEGLGRRDAEIAYLEYDLFPSISRALQGLKVRFAVIWGMVTSFLLLVAGLLYLSVLRPLRVLLQTPSSAAIHGQQTSAWIAEDIRILGQHLAAHHQRQQRMLKQLNDNEQRWMFAIDGSRNGIWDWNIASGEVYLSDRWKEMLGYQPQEIQDSFNTWKSRLHPDERETVLNSLQNYLSGRSRDFESLHRLLHRDGHYVWIMDRGMIVAWDEQGRPARIVGTHSDVSHDIHNQQVLAHLSTHDPLTNLANRNTVMKALTTMQERCVADDSFGALFVIDLDNFKVINDALGHQAGDTLLVQLAKRLKDDFTAATLVARLGGDEFVILLERAGACETDAAACAAAFASDVRQMVTDGFYVDGRQLHVSASIGIYLIGHRCILPADELLRRADMAMFKAKETGRDGCAIYSDEMELQASQHLLIQNDLRHAIERGQLALHYQPIVDDKGYMVAAEALLRWEHPRHGYISPAEFIPVAERSGLILSLSNWVIHEVCRFIVQGDAVGPPVPRISINISARQFNDAAFVEDLVAVLAQHGIAPARIELELTEHMLLADLSLIKSRFEALHRAGIAVAIDDFGTGYSSLNYLQHLPLSQLKIDASFVRQIGTSTKADAIVKTIVNMAHALELQVVAEGVETSAQRQYLLTLGCDSYQGFLWSKPLPNKAFLALLQHEYQSAGM